MCSLHEPVESEAEIGDLWRRVGNSYIAINSCSHFTVLQLLYRSRDTDAKRCREGAGGATASKEPLTHARSEIRTTAP